MYILMKLTMNIIVFLIVASLLLIKPNKTVGNIESLPGKVFVIIAVICIGQYNPMAGLLIAVIMIKLFEKNVEGWAPGQQPDDPNYQ